MMLRIIQKTSHAFAAAEIIYEQGSAQNFRAAAGMRFGEEAMSFAVLSVSLISNPFWGNCSFIPYIIDKRRKNTTSLGGQGGRPP